MLVDRRYRTSGVRSVSRALHRDEGAAAVEFALVGIFILIPLAFGAIQYAWTFFQMQQTAAAVREIAREVAVAAECSGDLKDRLPTSIGDAKLEVEPKSPPVLAGQHATVTVVFEPTRFGFPVPLPDQVTEQATVRMEQTPEAGCAWLS